MKSRVIKTVLGIAIFLTIIAAAMVVVRPMYKRVDDTVRSLEAEFLGKFEDKTGLSVSYKSLSPSILSGIVLNGISLRDAETQEEILTIKKTSVYYRLNSLLHGDMEHAFTKLAVNNVTVNFSQEKIQKLFSTPGEKKSGDVKEEKTAAFSISSVEDLVRTIAFSVPFDVQVKNVRFKFSSGMDVYSLALRELLLKKNDNASSVFLRLNGFVDSNISTFGYKSAGFIYRIDGNLMNTISGSSFRLRLDDYRRSQFSVKHQEFLLNYKDHNFIVRTTRNFFPLNLRVLFSLDSFTLESAVRMDRLNPLDMFRAPSYMGIINFFKGSLFTTESNFFLDFNTFKYTWSTNTTINMPKGKRFTKEGQNVYAKCTGNNTDVQISNLSADGGIFKGTYRGEFNLPKLQPKGTLKLDYFRYFNGNELSTAITFSPRAKEGFDFYMPEVRFGKWCAYSNFKCYSSLGKNIVLVVDADDYSHAEYGVPGHVTANGTLQLGDNMYLQASANLNNFFLDTGLKTAAFFTDREGGKAYVGPVISKAEPYITQVECYFATDFSNFMYNAPVVICANTQKDKEIGFVSFDGTGTSFSFSRIDIMYGNNSMLATGSLDIDTKLGQMNFFTDFNLNSFPYSVNGVYAWGEWLTMSGDYGFETMVNYGNATDGFLKFNNLPVSYDKYSASVSVDTNFSFSSNGTWDAFIDKFEISELTDNFRSKPKIVFAGEMNDKGLIASNILYSDNISSLDGTGFILWNASDSGFDNALVNINLASPVSTEKINFNGEARNMAAEGFSFSNFKKDLYFNITSNVSSFPVSRFVNGQGSGNTVSLNLNASGTVENPLYSIDIIDSSILVGGNNLTAKLNATYIDSIFEISKADVSWRYFSIDEVTASIDMSSFLGDAKFHFNMNGVDRQFDAGFDFAISNLSDSFTEGVPEAFSIEADCVSLESNFIESFKPFHISLIRSPGRMDIVTDENIGAYGEILDDGFVAFTVAEDKSLHFSMDGSYRNQTLDVTFNSFYWDLSKIAYVINSDMFTLYSGVLVGNLNISGSLNAPELGGTMALVSPDFNLPQYIPDHFTTDEIKVVFAQEEISLTETLFHVRTGFVAVSGLISLDRWALDNFIVNIRTLENFKIPIDAKVDHFRIKGFTSIDASLMLEDKSLILNGSVELQNSELSYNMSTQEQILEPINANINPKKKKKKAKKTGETGFKPSIDFNIDLALMIGQRVQIDVNPFLRSLIAPSTPIYVTADTATGLWSIKSDIVLRGGEISYLNRNFYLKQGRLVLNETQDHFDPNITVRAETRERDSSGDNVTIILSAISQHLSSFNAVLSSVPARSESEIMTLLGQIVSGDADSVGNLVISSMDYGVQVTLLRKFENALRDLCNFDIFSIRTTALQNTIMQGLELGNRPENNSVIGNLFDNSTVYIGKYFGSDVYADALLHWTYDRKIAGASEAMGDGLVFQPEIGLEFNAPFANIRWNFAPDLSDMQESWAKATSVTLSWRWAF
ncbi:translocation/assembly module TamB domain-containing protein [Treponema sp.]|uniref:translocation/assembly module TamB domain-containing protein n=1 Tax=Treponema sp. TaxID=166 RepID=UPI00298DF274|nr:translocation/assembly module TamB domain-containing protein [Treponema sp.]MCQ2241322.1 translocation/assembly module TamB [Treponema sp.]